MLLNIDFFVNSAIIGADGAISADGGANSFNEYAVGGVYGSSGWQWWHQPLHLDFFASGTTGCATQLIHGCRDGANGGDGGVKLTLSILPVMVGATT